MLYAAAFVGEAVLWRHQLLIWERAGHQVPTLASPGRVGAGHEGKQETHASTAGDGPAPGRRLADLGRGERDGHRESDRMSGAVQQQARGQPVVPLPGAGPGRSAARSWRARPRRPLATAPRRGPRRHWGLPELAEAAVRELPDPVDSNRLEEWCLRHGLTKDEVISRMGGSP